MRKDVWTGLPEDLKQKKDNYKESNEYWNNLPKSIKISYIRRHTRRAIMTAKRKGTYDFIIKLWRRNKGKKSLFITHAMIAIRDEITDLINRQKEPAIVRVLSRNKK